MAELPTVKSEWVVKRDRSTIRVVDTGYDSVRFEGVTHPRERGFLSKGAWERAIASGDICPAKVSAPSSGLFRGSSEPLWPDSAGYRGKP